MTKARDLADLAKNANDRLDTVATSDGALSNRNWLHNGSFDIWQRGTTATYSTNTGRGFVADRWFGEAYPLNLTYSKSTIVYDGITYNSANLTSITGDWTFYQGVEDGRKKLHNKTLTLSFVASGSGTIQPVTWMGAVNQQNFGSSITLTSTPTRYTITHTLDASATGDDMFMGLSGTGGNINISLIQLELGDTATLFEHIPYSDQLARCQRYYHKLDKRSVATCGHWGNSQPYVVEMRAAPTASWTAIDTVYQNGSAAPEPTINDVTKQRYQVYWGYSATVTTTFTNLAFDAEI